MDESLEQARLDLFAEDQLAAAVPLMTPEEEQRRRDLQRIPPDERAIGLLNVAQLKDRLDSGARVPYRPSRPCPRCGGVEAVVGKSGSQLPVTCTACGVVSYNAPKAEVGFAERSVKTLRDNISPAQQARILNRDHGRCLLCGSRDDLRIGHLLSVADGHRVGATREELNDDANLAAMCEACNAGLGKRSVSLSTYVIMLYLVQAERLDRQTGEREAPLSLP